MTINIPTISFTELKQKGINEYWLMPLILMAWGLFYVYAVPYIALSGGFGYDGSVFYGPFAMNFFEPYFWQQQIHDYTIQRIFTPFCVYEILNILNIEHSVENVVRGYQFFNMALLMGASILWGRLATMMKLQTRVAWLGFIFLFCNYLNMNAAYWNPVLSDTLAFFLGMLLAYGFYTNDLALKLLVALLGAFTWPTMAHIAILLCLFPRSTTNNLAGIKMGKNWLLSILAVGIFAGFFTWFYFNPSVLTKFGLDQQTEYFGFRPTMAIGMIGTLILIVLFINNNSPEWSSIKGLFTKIFGSTNSVKNQIKKLTGSHYLISVIACIATVAIIIMAKNQILTHFGLSVDKLKVGLNPLYLAFNMTMLSSYYPMSYIVESISVSGLIFFIFYYLIITGQFKNVYQHFGIGFYFIMIILFFLKMTPESRGVINLLPMLCMGIALYLNEFKISKGSIVFAVVASLVLSKVYISMEGIPDPMLQFWKFPNQYYFMNTYLLSGTSYAVSLSAMALMLLIYKTYFHTVERRIK